MNKHFKKYCVEYLSDFNNIPRHLWPTLWREDLILVGDDGFPKWAIGRPYNLPYKEITALYRKCCLYTTDLKVSQAETRKSEGEFDH